MIQILPKVFSGLGYGETSQASGINSGEGALPFGGGKIPMPLPGTVARLTLYGGVARDVDVTAAVVKNGTTSGLEVEMAAGAAGAQVFTIMNPVHFSAGDYLEYVFGTSDAELVPGLALAACVEIEAAAMMFGLSPFAGTIGVGATSTGGALGNGTLGSGGTYSICALDCVLTHLCLKRFAEQTGGAWTAWYVKNGVTQDGSGGTVDTTTTLDDADPDFIVNTFSLPAAPLDHVNVLLQRQGSEAAFATAHVGVGTAVTPNTSGEFMFCGGDNSVIPEGLTWKWMQSAQEGPTIGDHTAAAGQRSFVVNGLYVERENAPGGGNAYIQTLIKNGAPTEIVASISGAIDVAAQSDPARVTYHASDTLTIQIETEGSPSGEDQIHWAMAGSTRPQSGTIGPLLWWRFRRTVP